jgi:DNA replication protein DnaC
MTDKKGSISNIKKLADITSEIIDNYSNTQKRRGLVLWSETTGNGKTLSAAIIMNTLIFQYAVNAKFIKLSSDYFGRLKNSYQKNFNEHEFDIIKKLLNYDVLIIDDFGTHRSTDWENEKLYELIDGRNNYNKLTIITSNDNLTDRILSRIMEMCIIFEVKTPCYRKNFLIQK